MASEALSITTEGWVLPPQRVWLSLWFSERVLLWWGFFVFSPGDAFNRQLNALQEFSSRPDEHDGSKSPKAGCPSSTLVLKGCQLQECQSTNWTSHWVPWIGMTESRPRNMQDVSIRMRENKTNKRNLSDLWLIHVDVWQRLTRYCKAIVPQLKTTKKKTLFTSMVMIITQWCKKR